MQNFEKYINYVMLSFLILMFFRTCGIGSDVTKMKRELDELKDENLTKVEMIKIIKETPNWRTLEIEELSDKNRIPINYFKNDEERDTTR